LALFILTRKKPKKPVAPCSVDSRPLVRKSGARTVTGFRIRRDDRCRAEVLASGTTSKKRCAKTVAILQTETDPLRRDLDTQPLAEREENATKSTRNERALMARHCDENSVIQLSQNERRFFD